MKQLGLIPEHFFPAGGTDDWDNVADQAWEARCMEVYAAMIDNMDQGIGRIVGQLKSSGQLDNTMILFMQDNGGCAEGVGRQPGKPSTAELRPLGKDGLQTRVVPPMQTRDGRWVRTGPGVMPGSDDTYIAYGRAWASVSNTPFREFKHWTHEGGISTPLIVHWPAGTAADQRGRLEFTPAHLIDIMATCVDVSRSQYPQEFGGHPVLPMEGMSLAPAFTGQALQRPQPLFWEHEGNRAVRNAHWKLVSMEDQAWELYDINVDRGEQRDLALHHPDLVMKMASQWDAWAERTNVLPLGTWKARTAK